MYIINDSFGSPNRFTFAEVDALHVVYCFISFLKEGKRILRTGQKEEIMNKCHEATFFFPPEGEKYLMLSPTVWLFLVSPYVVQIRWRWMSSPIDISDLTFIICWVLQIMYLNLDWWIPGLFISLFILLRPKFWESSSLFQSAFPWRTKSICRY